MFGHPRKLLGQLELLPQPGYDMGNLIAGRSSGYLGCLPYGRRLIVARALAVVAKPRRLAFKWHTCGKQELDLRFVSSWGPSFAGDHLDFTQRAPTHIGSLLDRTPSAARIRQGIDG